jgi:tryptophan synthase beta chain
VEAAGKGVDTLETAATLTVGTPGVLHSSKTYLMQNSDGQITEPYSISAGLDYPGIGPIHAHLFKTGRAKYLTATDEEVLRAALLLTQKEGIIPALESAHAMAALNKIRMKPDDVNIVNLSGSGNKDMTTYMNYFGY